MRIAIDTGGTFTDCVYFQDGKLQVLKLFSTPSDPGQAVLEALRRVEAQGEVLVRHGTTVGTNAMIERKGARVAFVTTAGFEDTIAIGRQARARLYDWFQPAPDCLAPADLRFGIEERVSAEGEVLLAPGDNNVQRLAERIRTSDAGAVAISLLFSFANPINEQAVAAALAEIGIPVSISHRVLPEFREYERASTVVANAYLSRIVGDYMKKLAGDVDREFHGRLDVMQSSGGTIPARLAAEEPVRTMLSGPAGGVMGAYRMARLAGFDRIIGFDMGGTSTDVCLVDSERGGPQLTSEAVISDVPIGVPMLDIHTAGAGGGSLARFDAGGMLRVGPESAGASPGPICFGRGEQVTVTDANLILGRLDSESFLGGAVSLDRERALTYMETARGSIASVEEFAAGILRLVETSMEKAIRVISVERGYDPRDFTLVAFGGGGPLHACSLAHALRIPRVLVPALPGALSAVGILLADAVRDYSRTVMLGAHADLGDVFAELEARGRTEFEAEQLSGLSLRSLDLRYQGQGYELNVPFGPNVLDAFHDLHRLRYGFAKEEHEVEVVNVRVRMVASSQPFDPVRRPIVRGDGQQALTGHRPVFFHGEPHYTPVYNRTALVPGDSFSGPAIITEYSSATILPPGDTLRVDALDNLMIEVH
ncbi:MAG: N-methylhydantoinase [Acidobacteriaceae bacterium]|jgi:N-methylhydantoinase A|nr:N-methylhydantoinase [Acidobacteriaceae bacterium]